MRSSWPVADTSTPVRCGLVSSRDAARATRPIVSTKAPAGTCIVLTPSPSGSFGEALIGDWTRGDLHRAGAFCFGQLREIFDLKRAQVELARSGHLLDVLFASSVLEGQVVL